MVAGTRQGPPVGLRITPEKKKMMSCMIFFVWGDSIPGAYLSEERQTFMSSFFWAFPLFVARFVFLYSFVALMFMFRNRFLEVFFVFLISPLFSGRVLYLVLLIAVSLVFLLVPLAVRVPLVGMQLPRVACDVTRLYPLIGC